MQTLQKSSVSYNYQTAFGKSWKHIPEVNQEDYQTVIGWLYESYVILNIGKCHLVIMDKDVGENKTLLISNQQKTINNKEVEFLGAAIDKNYNFTNILEILIVNL